MRKDAGTFAAIDVGTNSIKLLVAAVRGATIVPKLHRLEITRLGEGLGGTNVLSSRAMDRTLRALRRFRALAGTSPLTAVGTHALRAARNGRAFLERCRQEAGIEVRVLRGREEARLAFLGATADRGGKTAALDVGGGSTEIMFGAGGRLKRAWSLPLGAVTLTERFLKSDPPAPDELKRLRLHVRRVLDRIDASPPPRTRWVGIGGTVATLAAIVRRGCVPVGALTLAATKLSCLPTASREALGLDPGRADIIVAGAEILIGAMRRWKARSLWPCRRGLRHGLLIEMASRRGL